MRKYSDLPSDFADACLIHLADELNTREILTLDRALRTTVGGGRDVLTC